MGDLPDFENMSEEEQMRWLESLAARQGADAQEFTTSADMEVPEVDPDSVVIDEPGYVPSETFSFSEQQPPAAEAGVTEPIETVEPMAAAVDDSDPMAFLDAMADNEDAFEDVLADLKIGEQATAVDDTAESLTDLEALSESDPMAFLEALAARQGADPNEFTTSADMEIPEVDPDSVVIDEPGYVPSETFSFSQQQPPPLEPEPPVSEIQPPVLEEPVMVTEPEADFADLDEADPMAFLDTLAAQQDDAFDIGEVSETSVGEPADSYADLQSLSEDDPMAFLEALAARQGADPTEFTTAADMAIPEIDPDSVVIDEPGYVPSETFSFSQQPETPTIEEISEPAEEPPAYDYSQYEQQSVAEDEYDYSQYTGTGDEQYAQTVYEQQPAVEGEYDYNQYTGEGDEQATDQLMTEQPPMDEAGALVDSELSPDDDPMKWLESLAVRQGVDQEELTTPADFEIPEVDPDTADMSHVGPGYTPYSPFETTPGQPQQPPPEALPEAPAEAAIEVTPQPEGESLMWLEDLATDHGTETSQFLGETEDAALPDFDLDFDTTGEEETAAISALTGMEPDAMPDFMTMSDEEIAQAQIEGTITPEQELEWLMGKAQRMQEVLDEPEAIQYDPDVEAVPGEVPDWLQEQMLAGEIDEIEETDSIPPLVDAITMPPEPTDLPDWLAGDAALDDGDALGLADLSLEDTTKVQAVDISPEASEKLLEGFDQSEDPWVEAFVAEDQGVLEQQAHEWYAKAIEDIAFDEPALPEPPIAVVETDDVPSWLSEDAGTIPGEDDSDLPEWLRMSVSDEVDSGIGDWLREQQVGVTDDVEAIAEPVVDEMGIDDWLKQQQSDGDATQEVETVTEVPEPTPPVVIAEPEVEQPAAQADQAEDLLPEGVDGAFPPWYAAPAPPVAARPQPSIKQPTPPPVAEPPPSVTPTPAPPPTAPAEIPASETFAPYRTQLEQNPDDHDTRLRLARELTNQGHIAASLQQYETLIDRSAMLDTLSTELVALTSRLPNHPKVRRLLGDTYMRQGYLQEALDAYRGALNQL